MSNLDDFDSLDLKSLDGISFDEPVPSSQPVPAPMPSTRPASGLGVVIQDLMTRRNYQQVLQIAGTQKEAVMADPQVRTMVESARAKLEQEAYLQSFIEAARGAAEAGHGDQAKSYLMKAQALDAEHPDVTALARDLDEGPIEVLNFDDTAPVILMDQNYGSAGGFAIDAIGDHRSSPVFTPTAPTPGPETSFGTLSFDDPPSFNAAGASFGSNAELPIGTESSFPAAAGAAFGAEASFGSTFSPLDTPSASGGFGAIGDGSDKIKALLAEGQSFFERDELQNAIDVWSRIFLIDIESDEASTRIEMARNRKAEKERQAEEKLHEAIGFIESKSLDEAKAVLAQVLELAPGHLAAREYLEQLNAGKVPAIRRAGEDVNIDLLDDGGFGDLQKAAGLGGKTGQTLEAAVARDRIVVVKKVDRKLLILGGLGAALLVGAIVFLATSWNKLFPNTQQQAAVAPRKGDSLERATKIYEAGKVENAIALLEKIPEGEDSYQEAQALIAKWRAAILQADANADVAQQASEQAGRRNALLGAAREASARRQFLRAHKYLDRAEKLQPLEGADLELKKQCDEALTPIAAEVQLFVGQQYEQALPALWRKREGDPKNPDIIAMIVDSYYNLAVADLQRSNAGLAAEKLKDALEVQPDNEELKRLSLFANSYSKRSPDMLYRIFIKHLPARS